MPETRRRLLKDILWVIAGAGLFAAALRFAYGIGSATGLNDASPWGLWIAFKLGFVALAGGGFTLAGMVYIFHLEAYRPILRRAILLALLGYASFIVSLIFDLGLPWHIYMPVISWQHHSVMFEIAWCVMLYFSVLLLEFGPVVLEHRVFQVRLFQKIAWLLHKATLPLVIGGIVLSTLHQSSLGALFLIMPQRVHPLWYSPWIPPLFFISAIAAGLMALIIESHLANKLFGSGLHPRLLESLSRIASAALALYLLLRVGDLTARGVLPAALDGSWQSGLFLAEILLGGALPIALLAIPAIRQRSEGLLTCAALVIGGALSQRMALSMFTMWRPQGMPYTPSLLEVILAFAIPAAAGLAYLFIGEQFAVFEAPARQPQPQPARQPALEAPLLVDPPAGLLGQLRRRSFYALVAAGLIIALLPAGFSASQDLAVPVKKSQGWETLRIDGNRTGLIVQFPHAEHQTRLALSAGSEPAACLECHHLSVAPDQAAACSECHADFNRPTFIFNHVSHVQELGGNQACVECHPGERLASAAAACQECHAEMPPQPGEAAFNPHAPGFRTALHDTCHACHQREAVLQERPELAECAACHRLEEEGLSQAASPLKRSNQ